MKKNNKNELNYRIYRVEIDSSNKLYDNVKHITMKRFHAENLEEALAELKEYKRLANKEYTYYVDVWTPIQVVRDGKTYEYDDFRKAFDFHYSFFQKVKSKLNYWFWQKPLDIYYKTRDLLYLIKTTHTYSSSWLIDDRLIEVLEFNLPILRKNKHALSWNCLDEAIREKYGIDVDIKKFHETHLQGYGKELEKRAVEIENKIFDKLLEDIKMYKYYSGGYEFILKSDKDLVESDKKWRHTLPLIRGSYDHYDYKKINEMANKCWNRIWTTFQKYGREFND